MFSTENNTKEYQHGLRLERCCDKSHHKFTLGCKLPAGDSSLHKNRVALRRTHFGNRGTNHSEHCLSQRRVLAHRGLMLCRCHDAICTLTPFSLAFDAMWQSDNILPSKICVESLWRPLPPPQPAFLFWGIKVRLRPPHEICSGSHSAAWANLLTNLCHCRRFAVFAWG